MARNDDLDQVADGIEALAHWLRRHAPSQLSSSRATTLDTLQAAGPLRVSDLAERESISQPGMTTMVNRLVADGLVERIPDETDRRASLVRITPAGKSFLTKRHRSRAATLRKKLAQLDEADQAALVAMLPALGRLTKGSS